jgi:predicted ATP-grasp superfamily ATP-dependent carboligase
VDVSTMAVESMSGDSQQSNAIVVGLESMQGLQAARILARRKVPVIAIAKDPKHNNCLTNVCKEIIFADTTTEELIRTLRSLGPNLRQKAVLFPCEDTSVLLVSRNREKLSEWYHVVLPPPDVVYMMMDKMSFYTYARKHGFPIPSTFFIYDRSTAEQAANSLPFPCIVKPSFRSPEWEQNTTLKAFKVSNAEELLDLYDHYHRWCECLIAQQWIEGTDANHYTCNCYFDAKLEPIVTFTSRKLRQWPPRTGQRCLGEECRNDIVLHETLRLFRSVRFRGLGYLDMKRDENSGKYFIVEPNIGRPTGPSAMAEAGGVELLYAMYCESVGWPMPTNLDQKYVGVKWIHLRRDFQSALYYWRQGELSLRDWWRSWRGKKAYALFSWSDPAPFIGDLYRSIRLFLSPQERRKRDHRKPVTQTGSRPGEYGVKKRRPKEASENFVSALTRTQK